MTDVPAGDRNAILCHWLDAVPNDRLAHLIRELDLRLHLLDQRRRDANLIRLREEMAQRTRHRRLWRRE